MHKAGHFFFCRVSKQPEVAFGNFFYDTKFTIHYTIKKVNIYIADFSILSIIVFIQYKHTISITKEIYYFI